MRFILCLFIGLWRKKIAPTGFQTTQISSAEKFLTEGLIKTLTAEELIKSVNRAFSELQLEHEAQLDDMQRKHNAQLSNETAAYKNQLSALSQRCDI